MVAPSKLFQEPICSVHCSQVVVHPGQSCLAFARRNLYAFTASCAKYYLPLLISPVVTKLGSLDRQVLEKAFALYLQAVASSAITANLFFLSVCVFRNLSGKYYAFTTFFLPALIGGSQLWLWPKRVLNLYMIAMSQVTIEILLRCRSNGLTRLICNSTLVQTLLFMLNSSVLMHFKRSAEYRGFWFVPTIAPRRRDQDQEVWVGSDNDGVPVKCTHEGESCLRHVLGGLKRYALLGLAIDLLGIVRRGRGITHVRQYKTTGFFTTYILIYRLSNCGLKELWRSNDDWRRHALSAFLGGAAYAWLDNLSIYTFSLALTVQLLWGRLCDHHRAPPPEKEPNVLLWMLRQLLRVPFSKLLVSTNLAIMVHCYFLHSHLLSSIGRNICNNITANCADKIYKRLSTSSLESLLKSTTEIPRNIFFGSS